MSIIPRYALQPTLTYTATETHGRNQHTTREEINNRAQRKQKRKTATTAVAVAEKTVFTLLFATDSSFTYIKRPLCNST